MYQYHVHNYMIYELLADTNRRHTQQELYSPDDDIPINLGSAHKMKVEECWRVRVVQLLHIV